MGYLKKRSTLPANRRVDLNTEIRQGSNERYEKEIEVATLDTLYVDENLDARVKVVLAGDAVGETSAFVKKVVGLTRIVTFSCTNGSVGATVDGIGIQSGASVALGKSVIFTITPEEGYEYTGTNPESVVVTEDITKSFVCTAAWQGLKFTCTEGTATVSAGAHDSAQLPENLPNDKGWDIEYSVDNGTTWSAFPWKTNPVTVTLNAGESVYLRGQLEEPWSYAGFYCFKTTGVLTVSGDLTSLLNGVGGMTDITAYENTFEGLFRGATITSAENLILPSTFASSWSSGPYKNLFMNCTSLVKAPVLNATTLTVYCYESMFNGCTSLNEIHCLATDISASSCTNGWVANVAASGDFYGKEVADWPFGVSGIPEGWTEHLD